MNAFAKDKGNKVKVVPVGRLAATTSRLMLLRWNLRSDLINRSSNLNF